MAVILLAAVCLCQCETQQTITTRSSTYSIDQKSWGGQAGGDNGDNKEIRKKFTNHGFTIDEEGNFQADNKNMYGDSKARGSKKQFQTKDSSYGKKEFATNEFKTPEYLKMQEFKGTKNAREDGNLAREGDTKKFAWRNSKKLFRSKTKDTSEYSSYTTGQYAKGKKKFSTTNNSSMMTAIKGAPDATATLETSGGYRKNKSMTKDDVKKMLSPGSYARGTGLVN